MFPLIVMVVAILIARAAGALAFLPVEGWTGATRVGLSVMFLFTATAHFTRMRQDLIRMVPPFFPSPGALVTFTGVAEIAGAIGLLVPGLAPWAAGGLILLLVAMFQANIHAARAGVTLRGRSATPLVLRLPLQVLWIGLLWWSAIHH